MAQFSSSLYPQTNPTNPVLLEFRRDVKFDTVSFAESVRLSLDACKRHWWSGDEATDAHLEHAKKVLTRLAALSG